MKMIIDDSFFENTIVESAEVHRIISIIEDVSWVDDFTTTDLKGKVIQHQVAYNYAFEKRFRFNKWTVKPQLHDKPRMYGDFGENNVFVEVEFGNRSAIYRDYYKFQYGLQNKLITHAVLIVPMQPSLFFPVRSKESISNMAKFDVAKERIAALPLDGSVLLIGLLSEN